MYERMITKLRKITRKGGIMLVLCNLSWFFRLTHFITLCHVNIKLKSYAISQSVLCSEKLRCNPMLPNRSVEAGDSLKLTKILENRLQCTYCKYQFYCYIVSVVMIICFYCTKNTPLHHPLSRLYYHMYSLRLDGLEKGFALSATTTSRCSQVLRKPETGKHLHPTCIHARQRRMPLSVAHVGSFCILLAVHLVQAFQLC